MGYKIVFLSHIDVNLYLFRLPIMKALVKEGWKVYALVPRGKYSDRFKNYGITHIDYPIERKSLNPFREVKTVLNIKEKLQEIKPDILHTFTVKPNIYGNIAGKLAGVPVIVNTVTGLGSFFIDNSIKAKVIRNLILNLYRITFKFSNAVIFQNQDDLIFFCKKNILSNHKAYLIKGSGIDTSLWKPMPRRDGDIIRLVTIGRLLKHKGIEEFIKVAKILKKIYRNKLEFIVIGGFYDGNPYSISKELIEEAVKSNVIIYYDWQPIEKVRQILSGSDIFVLLSYREGLPRTGIEALSLGLPIVASNVVGCRELVKNGKNGFLVDYQDIEGIVGKIEKLINFPDLRKKMGMESRKIAEKEFDEKIIVEKYLILYRKLLSRSGL